MKILDWEKWFKQWVEHHPLKKLPDSLRFHYTSDVMARIRVFHAPSPGFPRFSPLRWGVLCGTVGVSFLLLFIWIHRPLSEAAPHPIEERNGQLLSELADAIEYNARDLDKEIQMNGEFEFSENFSLDEGVLSVDKTLKYF